MLNNSPNYSGSDLPSEHFLLLSCHIQRAPSLDSTPMDSQLAAGATSMCPPLRVTQYRQHKRSLQVLLP